MERAVSVLGGVQRLGRLELRGRPADCALREPVALVVAALLDRAAVKVAGGLLDLPPGDPVLLLILGERVELLAGQAEAFG